MKIIFLDFDGVINNWNNFYGVDENNAHVLKEIIEKTGAKVVATTSNKYSFQSDSTVNISNTNFFKICLMLKELGIEIDDVTPMVGRDKSLEIKGYLKAHPEAESYVILDDEIVSGEFIEHQVYLDLYRGLQPEHILPAINILNGILEFYPKDYDIKETMEKRLIRINQYYNKN